MRLSKVVYTDDRGATIIADRMGDDMWRLISEHGKSTCSNSSLLAELAVGILMSRAFSEQLERPAGT